MKKKQKNGRSAADATEGSNFFFKIKKYAAKIIFSIK
jgi:hypothetical protein